MNAHNPSARLRPFRPQPFGRYTLLSHLGTGGMGEIYLARLEGAQGFEKLCVIKKILPQLAEDSDFVERFVGEARTLVRLSHGSIAQVLDMGLHEGEAYMALEHVDGKDLRKVAARVRDRQVPLPLTFILYVMGRVLDALAYAHRKKDDDGEDLKLVHRDISPQNILISYEGEVKVIDFGLAKSRLSAAKTNPSIILGKFLYMSPEQARHQPVDRRSDLYAVGLTLYELISGKNPFDGIHPGELMSVVANPKVAPLDEVEPLTPRAVTALVAKALEVDPAQRFQSAEEFRGRLQACLMEIDPSAGPESVSRFMRELFAADFQFERRLLTSLRDVPRGGGTSESRAVEPDEGGPAPRPTLPAGAMLPAKTIRLDGPVEALSFHPTPRNRDGGGPVNDGETRPGIPIDEATRPAFPVEALEEEARARAARLSQDTSPSVEVAPEPEARPPLVPAPAIEPLPRPGMLSMEVSFAPLPPEALPPPPVVAPRSDMRPTELELRPVGAVMGLSLEPELVVPPENTEPRGEPLRSPGEDTRPRQPAPFMGGRPPAPSPVTPQRPSLSGPTAPPPPGSPSRSGPLAMPAIPGLPPQGSPPPGSPSRSGPMAMPAVPGLPPPQGAPPPGSPTRSGPMAMPAVAGLPPPGSPPRTGVMVMPAVTGQPPPPGTPQRPMPGAAGMAPPGSPQRSASMSMPAVPGMAPQGAPPPGSPQRSASMSMPAVQGLSPQGAPPPGSPQRSAAMSMPAVPGMSPPGAPPPGSPQRSAAMSMPAVPGMSPQRPAGAQQAPLAQGQRPVTGSSSVAGAPARTGALMMPAVAAPGAVGRSGGSDEAFDLRGDSPAYESLTEESRVGDARAEDTEPPLVARGALEEEGDLPVVTPEQMGYGEPSSRIEEMDTNPRGSRPSRTERSDDTQPRGPRDGDTDPRAPREADTQPRSAAMLHEDTQPRVVLDASFLRDAEGAVREHEERLGTARPKTGPRRVRQSSPGMAPVQGRRTGSTSAIRPAPAPVPVPVDDDDEEDVDVRVSMPSHDETRRTSVPARPSSRGPGEDTRKTAMPRRSSRTAVVVVTGVLVALVAGTTALALAPEVRKAVMRQLGLGPAREVTPTPKARAPGAPLQGAPTEVPARDGALPEDAPDTAPTVVDAPAAAPEAAARAPSKSDDSQLPEDNTLLAPLSPGSTKPAVSKRASGPRVKIISGGAGRNVSELKREWKATLALFKTLEEFRSCDDLGHLCLKRDDLREQIETSPGGETDPVLLDKVRQFKKIVQQQLDKVAE
ncbi:serine/threonine protein kinase [Myxococcus stipitatus DSM 14675]|uniref:Serine/threonine protein kinase n=1 Tax=Myxococcus stipitatus (strain DSM 14675 / JCM 12634 / Mx s8) TaxID=1278073 RepID=L7UHI7_MYXSD|nr:serine/threonine-protein kinase [Myxococcus stipitatus]AGC48436.1 serine/threonine protein kinase [Myxococcus stipitatus DSM 14675]